MSQNYDRLVIFAVWVLPDSTDANEVILSRIKDKHIEGKGSEDGSVGKWHLEFKVRKHLYFVISRAGK